MLIGLAFCLPSWKFELCSNNIADDTALLSEHICVLLKPQPTVEAYRWSKTYSRSCLRKLDLAKCGAGAVTCASYAPIAAVAGCARLCVYVNAFIGESLRFGEEPDRVDARNVLRHCRTARKLTNLFVMFTFSFRSHLLSLLYVRSVLLKTR